MDVKAFTFRYRILPTQGWEYVSPSIRDVAGYEPEDFYRDPDFDLAIAHPEDRGFLAQMAAAPPERAIFRITNASGEIVWLEVSNFCLEDDDGENVAVEGVVRILASENGHSLYAAQLAGGTGPLSRREKEVLRLVADGLTNPQIAVALEISPRTVAHHLRNIMSKLGVHNRTAAVAAVYRVG